MSNINNQKVLLSVLAKDPSAQQIRTAVRSTAEAATDFSWLSKGDTVFIKPALNSGNPYPATTHPLGISSMIELLREKGARRVIVGDMAGIEYVKLSPNGLSGSTRRLMEGSGMAMAAQAAGAELHFFEEAGWNSFYEDMPTSGSNWKRGIMMPNILKEVDHIILMPRCGRHVLLGTTLGLKSAVGYWRTDTRLEYHHDASTIHEKTVEGNTVETLLRKQRLVLTVADKILTTFGPDAGYVVQPETGLVIASQTLVAHEMVSMAWLLYNRGILHAQGFEAFRDKSGLVASIGNRWIVGKLGGLSKAFTSEKLTKCVLSSLGDDRVMNHAYKVFGGKPTIALESSDGLLSYDLKKRLIELLRLSGRK